MESLTYQQHVMIHLPWHHFVDILRFTVDRAADDQVALSSLLRASEYDDAYEGPSGLGEGRHGPYPLETVGVESFEARTREAVQSQIHEWLTLAREPDPDPADPMNADLPADPRIEPMLNEHVFSTLETADALYQLVLPKSAEGPEGWPVARANGFHEFIAINRDAGRLTLLVCTDDLTRHTRQPLAATTTEMRWASDGWCV